MDVVGHDFFLFIDADTALPSVAYRRRGWSCGVIRLDSPVSVTAQAVERAVGPAGGPGAKHVGGGRGWPGAVLAPRVVTCGAAPRRAVGSVGACRAPAA